MDLLPSNDATIEYLRREAPWELERLRSIDRLGADQRRNPPTHSDEPFPTGGIRQSMSHFGAGLAAVVALVTVAAVGLAAMRAGRPDRAEDTDWADRLGAYDGSPFDDELEQSFRWSTRHAEPFHECFV
jgi:hypothetical protein